MEDVIYTIGYSGFSIGEFVETLKKYNVSAIIDVRSSPYSGYYSDYNAELLASVLKKNGIGYRSYALEFGAHQTDPALFTPKGYLDFNLYKKTNQFLDGTRKIEDGIVKGFTPALMCAEKKPMNCHRAILVAKWFSDNGYNVVHILPDGVTETQEDIDDQLKDLYFPNRMQLTIDTMDKTEEAWTKEAYEKANEKIGYREAAEKDAGENEYEYPDLEAI